MTFGMSSAIDLGIVIEATDAASSVLEGIGKAIEGVIGTTADLQTTLNQVQNNTTLTTAQMDQMRQSILAMGRESGAPLDDLANAFMHATNLGFGMADATKVVQAGMESAVSTGANVSDVVTTLALQMHEFGMSADDAGRAMNVLHLAAALGNATLEQFSTQTTKATSMAANLGIPITQVDAALAALSRHMDLSQANTALAGEFSKLINPAESTIKELKHLGDTVGIDLVHDFTYAGMQAKGFPAVMDDLRRATGGNVTEMLKLIPAMRGGLAEMVLLGTGSKDYTDILQQLNDAMAGTLDPTTQAYQRTLHTFGREWAIITGDVQQFAIEVGTPILAGLQGEFDKLGQWFQTHQADVDRFGTALGVTIANAVQGLITNVPLLVSQLGLAVNNISSFADTIGGFFDTAGTGIHEALYQITAGIYDTVQGLNSGLDDTINRIAQALGQPGITPATADQMAVARTSFLSGLFPDINPATGGPYAGGGGPLTATGRNVGGGGGAYSADMPGVNLQDPHAVKAWIAAQGSGAGSGSGGASGANSYAGTGAGSPGYLDAQQALAAAQRVLRDAQDRYDIDFSRNRTDLTDPHVHALLVSDIGAILKDMAATPLGNDALDIQKAQQDLMSQIAGHTKGTHQVFTNWRIFSPFAQATEGQTIAAYGLGTRPDGQARTIAALERLVAQQEAKLRQDEQLIATYQQMLSRETETARNTAAMAGSLEGLAHEAATPHQHQNPLTSSGLGISGRK